MSYTSQQDTMGAAHRSKSNMQQASHTGPAKSWYFVGPNVTHATSCLKAGRNYQAGTTQHHSARGYRNNSLILSNTTPKPRTRGREGGRVTMELRSQEWNLRIERRALSRFPACNLSIQIIPHSNPTKLLMTLTQGCTIHNTVLCIIQYEYV